MEELVFVKLLIPSIMELVFIALTNIAFYVVEIRFVTLVKIPLYYLVLAHVSVTILMFQLMVYVLAHQEQFNTKIHVSIVVYKTVNYAPRMINAETA